MRPGTFQKFRGRLMAAGLLGFLVIGFGIGESPGWPFLAAPMQGWIGQTLDRRVSFSADPAARPVVQIHLLGGGRGRAHRNRRAGLEQGAAHAAGARRPTDARLWRPDPGRLRRATAHPRPRLPMLSGRLTGTNLALADLGPAVGAPVRKGAAPVAVAASAPPPTGKRAGHVLPNRELEARTGQGRLLGTVQLDGCDAQALWTANLRWDGVRLESWIQQDRKDKNSPPYVTGGLNGRARVAGQGKSTAAILGSLRGEARMQLVDGTISHLAVEAAGLDIAEGLGTLIKGDDVLPIQCTVVDLVAEQGLFRPRVMVLDTADSTLWVDGSLSLATEALDLRVVGVA
jgi:hypothetical protein